MVEYTVDTLVHLYDSLNGKRNKAGGFIWKKEDQH